MATESHNGKKRDRNGRFVPGNGGGPGRRLGVPNKTSIEGRQVRQAILDCWQTIDGEKKLAEWAEANFEKFLHLLVGLLPRDEASTIGLRFDGLTSVGKALMGENGGRPVPVSSMLKHLDEIPIPPCAELPRPRM